MTTAPAGSAHPDEVSRAHHGLRLRILSGDLRAGAPLSQVDLARQFGVSRGPLREALRILQREGFLYQEPQHRARVAAFSAEDLDELAAMRIALETLAIQTAVRQGSTEHLARLDPLLDAMDEAMSDGDLDRWEQPHDEFHRALAHPAGERIERELALLSDHAARYRLAFVTLNPIEWEARAGEHREIADAVQRRDETAAATRLAAHLARTALVVLSVVSPTYDPVRIRLALTSACGPDAPVSSTDALTAAARMFP